MTELRPYQKDLISGLYKEYRSGKKRVLMQLPTGGGKTHTCATVINDAVTKGGNVLVIAHRAELITQMHETLKKRGIFSGIIKAGIKPTRASVQVASIQSLARRLDRYRAFSPKLIVVDECHHITTGNQYSKVFEAYSHAFVLGLTATPTRLDGKGLGDVFESLVHGPQLHELVEMGFLVPPSYFVGQNVMGDHKARTRMGDYSIRDLSDAVSETRLEGDLVREWSTHAQGLQTVVFAVNVEHSEAIVEAYGSAGISAAHLDGKTKRDRRVRILAAFARKEIQVLSNVGIISEGFDVPAISCVQLARPTQSVALMYQMIGRALRPAEGKPEAVVLDHAGIYAQHGNVLTPYHWSLSTTKPKEAQADWMGEAKPREKKERIITYDGLEVLVKVDYSLENAWLEELRRLQSVCSQYEYKPGWIAHKMCDRFKGMTLEQYRVIAKVCGYHWKWANRQFEAQEVAA